MTLSQRAEHPSVTRADASATMVRPGEWELDGERVALIDARSGWLAWHRAFFDEVGTGAAYFLYLAGLRTASGWTSGAGIRDALAGGQPASRTVDADQIPHRLCEAGLGLFTWEHRDAGTGRGTILARGSFEADAFERARQRANFPTCGYTAGLLAGLWTAAVERSGGPADEVVCREVACVALGAPSCRFELGPADMLDRLGIVEPAEVQHVLQDLLDLSRRLHHSTERLTDLERKLAEREEAYKGLIDNIYDSLLVINAERRIVFCNRGFLDRSGMTLDQALGASPIDWVHQDDRAKVEAAYDDLLSGRKSTTTYMFRVERDGRTVYTESNARAIRGPDGRLHIETLARDVTERELSRRTLEAANADLMRRQRSADTDLKVAKLVHESLLPESTSLPELDLDIRYKPVNRVGGDYVHLAFPPDGRMVVAVSDVSGHGMASALLAARVSSFLDTVCQKLSDPEEICDRVNEFLVNRFEDTGLFVTFVAISIDLATFRMRYAGCGHPGPILLRAGADRPEILRSHHLPLGIMLDYRRSGAVSELTLAPGDRLLVYTDGVIETTNATDEPIRAEGLADWFIADRNRPAFEVGSRLLDRILEWSDGAPGDDITMIQIEMKQPGRPGADGLLDPG